MKKRNLVILVALLIISLVGCNSSKQVEVKKENEYYLVGKWKVSDGTESSIQEWRDDGTIIFETGEKSKWRIKGENEPNNTLSWKANTSEYDNSQIYFQIIDDADFIKYTAIPIEDNSYKVITEVIYSGTTKTFIYEPHQD